MRKILVYGHGDKSGRGFETPATFEHYLERGIFQDRAGRYRYSQTKSADIIVLARDGLAYGHFETSEAVQPTEADRKEFPPVRKVYLIQKSARYRDRVQMSALGIVKYQFGRYIEEHEFSEILRCAGGVQEFRPR